MNLHIDLDIQSQQTDRKRNRIACELLLRSLRKNHFEHAPHHYKDRFLPVIIDNPLREYFVSFHSKATKRRAALEAEQKSPPLKLIVLTVCAHFNVREIDFVSQRRTLNLTLPRHISFYLGKDMTTKSLPQIGQAMGGRDHTSVLHGIKKIERLMTEDKAIADVVIMLRNKVRDAQP